MTQALLPHFLIHKIPRTKFLSPQNHNMTRKKKKTPKTINRRKINKKKEKKKNPILHFFHPPNFLLFQSQLILSLCHLNLSFILWCSKFKIINRKPRILHSFTLSPYCISFFTMSSFITNLHILFSHSQWHKKSHQKTY